MTTTFYLSKVLDTALLTTANDVSIVSGATNVGQDTPIGTLTGYGELCPNTAPATWPAYGSEGAVPFSGKGNIYPVSLLGQALLDGSWTPTLRCSVVGTSPVAIVADLIVRVWVWNSNTQLATKRGVITLVGQTIGTTSTTYTFLAATLSSIAFEANDYLYFDTLANVTSNPNGATVGAKIRCNFSSSATQGSTTAQVVAPNLVSARTIPATAALQATLTRTVPTSAALLATATRTVPTSAALQATLTRTIPATAALLATATRTIPATAALQATLTRTVPTSAALLATATRTIPATAALLATATRTIPATASLCRGPLGLPYVQPVADNHFVTASDGTLVYRSRTIKLYGATIYLSTQGGASTWLYSDATLIIDNLFENAYQNGLSMIRITDFWDASDVTGLDNPQLWQNIDYCVTLAQRMGMFVMMDVSAYKNVLTASGMDYTVASNWTDWLTFVGMHYRNTATAICWYNILGEPSVPTNQAGCTALGAFYETLCSTLNAADNGTHLIEAGGLTHMNQVVSGLTDPAWWYAIYTAPHNTICGYKTYSVNDLSYLSTVQSIMQTYAINKPLANNEFGCEQEQSDSIYPTFTNTLASAITAGNTVTSLTLNAPITSSVVAGTIIGVSATENFVVAATTSSGTSLPVQSVAASANHAIGDSVAALGFADVPHSLGDTVANFFRAVLGTSTSILKWNSTPRTLVPTTVPGGDQVGTISYVVWNLGYQINPTSYDVGGVGCSQYSWLLFGTKSRADGYQPLFPYPPLTITIAGQLVSFIEDTFQINYRENEQWRFQFTVPDYSNSYTFVYRSLVQVVDSTLGPLFTGFLLDDTLDRTNTNGPDPYVEHKIDCIGNEARAAARTSNRLYTVPTPAGQIALDMLRDVLTAEGVLAKYAALESAQQSDWATYTLSGTAAANNLQNGDLELAPAGSTLTVSEAVTVDFAAGTLTDVQAAANALTLQSYTGIAMTATCIGNVGDAKLYWTLYNTPTAQTGNWFLDYTMWIDGSSPQIMAGVEIVYTDGSSLAAQFSGVGQYDQHGIGSNPKNDLAGWANNQWYSRTIGLYPFNGKTIAYVALAFEGDNAGNYGVYLQSCTINNGSGTTYIDAVNAFNGGGQVSNNGYTTISVGKTTVYAQSGTRISPAHNLASVGIYQNSLASWIVNEIPFPATVAGATPATSNPLTHTAFTLSTSFDGGATWQTATNRTKLGIITAGSSVSAHSLLLKESLSITGNTPTVTPQLTQVAVTLIPSYVASLTDAMYTRTTPTDFGAGTLTNLVATSSGLGLNGWWRNWAQSNSNSLASDQTVWGTATPTQQLSYNQLLTQTNSGGSANVQMVGAGQWQNFTAAVTIQVPTTGNGAIGLIYRTTGWQNNDNTFAYAVEISTTAISILRGTNSASGTGGRNVIGTAAVTLSVSTFYTLKLVVNGGTHQVYIDDVLYLTVSDSTYSAAGYIGLRLYNNSGVQISGYYSNLAILASLTGQYVSENLSLNAVGTVGTSRIFWQDDTPGSSTLLVETSINGGASWQTAIYGQTISGLNGGTTVTGVNLKVRITLTAISEQDQPVVTGYTAWITTQYSASGTAITPALSLSAVGQVGSTLAAWAALLATNTNVTVDTSINGGTSWTLNVAPGSLITAGSTQYAGTGAIGGINTQPDPTSDNFSTNTSANYSAGHQYGGSDGAWAYTGTPQRLVATGGQHAIYRYQALTNANIDIVCDMDLSDAGGLLFCRSSSTVGYVLVAYDNQSAVGTPNTMTLYRDGVAVASASITFYRGLFARLRAVCMNGVITATFDGTVTMTYTDSAPLPAGNHGLFSDGGTARFAALRLQPLGDNVSTLSVLARLNLSSTDPTVTPQVQQFVLAATGPQIGVGTTIPSADYRSKFIDKNLDDAAKQSTYTWHIGPDNELIFNGRQASPAPWIAQSNILGLPSWIELDSNLGVETVGDLYRNRQTLTGVINSAVFADAFVGNGLATSFTLRYPIAPGTFPTITLNGQAQTAALKGTTGYQWYYATNNDLVIAQDTTNALPLSDNDLLVVSYTGTFTDEITVDNTAAQAALAPITGGTGIVEAVEDVSSRNMTYAAAQIYAQQLLTRYCITGQTIVYATKRNGLWVGMMQPVQIPEERLLMAQMLITAIDLTMQVQPDNTVLYTYVVTASELPPLASFGKLIGSGLLT